MISRATGKEIEEVEDWAGNKNVRFMFDSSIINVLQITQCLNQSPDN